MTIYIMGTSGKILAGILISCISAQLALGDGTNGTCGLEELNHSVLIECNGCSSPIKTSIGTGDRQDDLYWPTDSSKIFHVQSTHAGKRFALAQLPKLSTKVDERTRLFDINTTLAVKTSNRSKRLIEGLGGTLDANHLADAFESDAFERIYRLIFDDLFAQSMSGARMGILRLQLNSEMVSRHNVTGLLVKLDDKLTVYRTSGGPRYSILLQWTSRIQELDLSLIVDLGIVSKAFKNINIWGLALDSVHEQGIEIPVWRHSLPSGCRLMAAVRLRDAPDLADFNAKQKLFDGLLIYSEVSIPYDVLDYVVAKSDNVLTVGRARPQTKMHGDWLNAHDSAVEILNLLKHGSNGYLEVDTIADLEADPSNSSPDCPIYSLAKSLETHFKGPMFYAAAHFSRYLSLSYSLDYELFTQPNMFAAHYSAFVTKDGKYIISVVLNGNEHPQPFSWNMDDTIVANTLLDAKSFNTFIMKV